MVFSTRARLSAGAFRDFSSAPNPESDFVISHALGKGSAQLQVLQLS